MKIKVNEDDIRYMVSEGVKRVLREARTDYESTSWIGIFNFISYLSDCFSDIDVNEIVESIEEVGFPMKFHFDLARSGGITGAGPDDYGVETSCRNEDELNSLIDKFENSSDNEFVDACLDVVYDFISGTDINDLKYKYSNYVEER